MSMNLTLSNNSQYQSRPNLKLLKFGSNPTSAGELMIELNSRFADIEDKLGIKMSPAVKILESSTPYSTLTTEQAKTYMKQRFNLFAEEARNDGLTQIPNRKAYDIALVKAFSNALEKKEPLTVVMMDIDHFKKYNDTYGHDVGDKTLKTVASIIKDSVGKTGEVFRYGGEEFACIMPNTNAKQAFKNLEKLRKDVEEQTTPSISGLPKNVTLSIGFSTLPKNKNSIQVKELSPEKKKALFIHKQNLQVSADINLYASKKAGRNRVSGLEYKTTIDN